MIGGFHSPQWISKCLKFHLDNTKQKVAVFKNNYPGKDWMTAFLKRHNTMLSQRFANNIKRARAQMSRNSLEEYHKNITESINGLSPQQIFNYDETNIADHPNAKKFIFRRGIK